jgi:rhodanese-related sulfurtransferase
LVPGIEARAAAQELSSRREVVIADVRGSGEYAFGHIPRAKWIPRGKLELQIATFVPDKISEILTVCDSGIRSALAAAKLHELGYQNVKYVQGGLKEWRKEGLDIKEGLDGANVSREEAQADFGHTVWNGALGKTRADMERYLAWEEALKHN